MKKILVILMLSFSFTLKAEIGADQLVQVTLPRSEALKRAFKICEEKGFSHFFITKISYKDKQRGQSLEFKGVPKAEEGTLLRETLTEEFELPIGVMDIELEWLFYNKAPNDPLAVKGSYRGGFSNETSSMQSGSCFPILDQSIQVNFSISSVLKRALEICKEKKFPYFLIKRVGYRDERGQSLLFEGIPSAESGILLSETIEEECEPPVGKLKVDFEIFFFKETPADPLAIVIGEVFDFLPSL